MDTIFNKDRYAEIKKILETSQRDHCILCKKEEFSPRILALAGSPISHKDIQVSDIIISETIWELIAGGNEWSYLFDNETNPERLMKGHVGLFYGKHIWTDGYLPLNERFMGQDEIIMIGNDQFSILQLT